MNGINLHSSYDPQKEAERFVDNISCSYNPACIIITGPALSWTAVPLKKRFPQATLCAIRYSHDFSDTDTQWDIVFDGTAPAAILEDKLFNTFGEEIIFMTLFIAWQPSASAYSETHKTVWESIKHTVLKSRSILGTRTFFAERWLKNACRFCTLVHSIYTVIPGTSAVLAVASGPSLKSSIPFILHNRNSFFILAVSSALQPLLAAGITPDLVISTDGGYYARRHLLLLEHSGNHIPVALTAESAADSSLLSNGDILPLTYGDVPEKNFLDACTIHAVHAERNGTVSGTAAMLALSITSGPIFFCGLDLAPAKGYQHMQPNALEQDICISDTRLHPLSLRVSAAGLPSPSMDLYRQWFTNLDVSVTSRLFRLSDHYRYANVLGTVRDISWDAFSTYLPKGNTVAPSCLQLPSLPARTVRIKALRSLIRQLSSQDVWLNNAFPADYLLWKRSTPDAAHAAQLVLEQDNRILVEHLMKVLHG